MRITSHPLCGSAATSAVRNSKSLDPTVRVHLRLVEAIDIPLISTLSPGPSPGARQRWIHHVKSLEAQGREFNFVVVDNGIDSGLVRMNDFIEIGGEASFRWGDFVSLKPGLLTATALIIYNLGFNALGYARAHIAVPRTSPEIAGFHRSTGAVLEHEDVDNWYYRFDAETYDWIRADAMGRRTVTVAAEA